MFLHNWYRRSKTTSLEVFSYRYQLNKWHIERNTSEIRLNSFENDGQQSVGRGVLPSEQPLSGTQHAVGRLCGATHAAARVVYGQRAAAEGGCGRIQIEEEAKHEQDRELCRYPSCVPRRLRARGHPWSRCLRRRQHRQRRCRYRHRRHRGRRHPDRRLRVLSVVLRPRQLLVRVLPLG